MKTLYECVIGLRKEFTGAVAPLTFLLRHAKSCGRTLSSLPDFRSIAEVHRDNYHAAYRFVPAYYNLFKRLRLTDLELEGHL